MCGIHSMWRPHVMAILIWYAAFAVFVADYHRWRRVTRQTNAENLSIPGGNIYMYVGLPSWVIYADVCRIQLREIFYNFFYTLLQVACGPLA